MNLTAAASCQIGISVYRQPLPWLQQCICSALQQASSDLTIQITVRTDGPNSCDTDSIIWLRESTVRHPEVELIEGRQQLGTYGSYRQIFQYSSTPFLCQLDADDWLESGAIQQGLELLLKHPNSPFLYTSCREVASDGAHIRVGARSQRPFSQLRMLVQFMTFHLRLIRRSAYDSCGGYDPSLLYSGDYDLSLRLCEIADPIYLPKQLYNYRLHSSNTSGLRRQQTIDEAFQVAQSALARRNQQHIYALQLDANASRVNLGRRMGPVLIAGMHRSGTSLLALMLQKLGLDLGGDLLAPDQQNPDGYGEDRAIVNLQCQLLQEQTGPGGWRDWGWSSQTENPDFVPDPDWQASAQAYLQSRRRHDHPWGWKDPRSTLLLNHWLSLDPGLRVIGIYREPWEVVDALQRIRPPLFLSHPGWGLPIWLQYNQALLDFAKLHPERCILINSGALVQEPGALMRILEQRWQWPVPRASEATDEALQALIRRDRLKRLRGADPLVQLYQTCRPDAWRLLKQLDRIADLPSSIKSIQPATTSLRLEVPERLRSHAQIAQRHQANIAVIITSHNQGSLLLEAVASVDRCRPDSLDLELLIVDDGSTDPETRQVLHHLDRSGYRVRRQSNQGLPSARNTGLRETQAPVVLYLDDDNRLLHPYLTVGLQMLERHPRLDVIYGDRQDFGLVQRHYRIGPVSAEDLWQMNRIDNCALIRRALLERCEGYTTQLHAFEDWDLWLKALRQPSGLNLGYLDQPCFEYRVRPNSMLQRLLRSPALQRQVMQQLRERHGDRLGNGGFPPALKP